MKVVLEPRALTLLKEKYLLPGESPEELFYRVSCSISLGNKGHQEEFFKVLCSLEFLPNSPTLMNAGTDNEQLIACFVLPVLGNLTDLYRTLKLTSEIQKSGGGTGFSLSRFKDKEDLLAGLQMIALITRLTQIQGRRRGANMGILPINHPAILDFIQFKKQLDGLNSFNLSVGITDKFMKSISVDRKAKQLFDLICHCAWETGDPGLIFLDEIHRKQPLPAMGKIEATNPCGEVPLFPFEACVLGSINLSKILFQGKNAFEIDFIKLKKLVRLGVRFLDNVIDQSQYPSSEIENQVKASRKIGLGVMGFFEMLSKMDISYESEKAVKVAERLMEFISQNAWQMSQELALEKGPFPLWEKSRLYLQKKLVRNATVTAIAPTGSISVIAGTSPSIEPFLSTGKLNIKWKIHRLRAEGVRAHLDIQEAFQKFTDNSVSKTINLASDTKIDLVRNIFLEAWKKGLKGITIYRSRA